MSVRNREVLRRANSAQVFLTFLHLQVNAEMVPKIQVRTVSFPSSTPDLNSSALSSLLHSPKYCFFFQIMQIDIKSK
jgi:hypothetical protein